jgi:hypothetical protein
VRILGFSEYDGMHAASVPAAGLCSNGCNNITATDAAAMRYGTYEGEDAHKPFRGADYHPVAINYRYHE